jgi:hypothetical protein
MTIKKCISIILTFMSLILFTSCTHAVVFSDIHYSSGSAPAVEGKKVAIVVDPGLLPNEIKSKPDANTYVFTEMVGRVTEALQRAIGKSAASITIKKSDELSKSDNFDFLLYPELKIRITHDFWTRGCLINYRLEIRDGSGKVTSDKSGEAKRTFMDAGGASSTCNDVLSEVFQNVTTKALRDLKP